MGCSFWGWAGVGEGTGEGAGEAGAAGSFSSLALLLLWFLSSGPAVLGLSFASSFLRTRPLGDAVMPLGDGGFGGRVCPGPGLGQGEAGLCQEGEDGRALDLGLREKMRVRTGGQRVFKHAHTTTLSVTLPHGNVPSLRLGQHSPPICSYNTVSFPHSAYSPVCNCTSFVRFLYFFLPGSELRGAKPLSHIQTFLYFI